MKQRSLKKNVIWNFRILAHIGSNGQEFFEIHEVYYQNEIPQSYTENAIAACGDSKEDVIEDLKMMLKDALKQTVLWSGERFPEEYNLNDDNKKRT